MLDIKQKISVANVPDSVSMCHTKELKMVCSNNQQVFFFVSVLFSFVKLEFIFISMCLIIFGILVLIWIKWEDFFRNYFWTISEQFI